MTPTSAASAPAASEGGARPARRRSSPRSRPRPRGGPGACGSRGSRASASGGGRGWAGGRWRRGGEREGERRAEAAIEPGGTVVSDGLSSWPAVEKAGCSHRPMVTGSGKRAANWTPFEWVNTVPGNVKTALAGTYHHVSPKHAQFYLTSFAYRFDRRFQLDSIAERLAWAATRTAPHPYRVITADA